MKVDKARMREHLGELLRARVKQALNAMLKAEAARVSRSRHHSCRLYIHAGELF